MTKMTESNSSNQGITNKKVEEEFTLMLETARKVLNIKDAQFFAVVDKENRMHVLSHQLLQSDNAGAEAGEGLQLMKDGCWWFRRGRRTEEGSEVQSFRVCWGGPPPCEAGVIVTPDT